MKTLQAGLLTILLLAIEAINAAPIPAISDYTDGISADEAEAKGNEAVDSTVESMQCLGLPDTQRWLQIACVLFSPNGGRYKLI